MEKYTKVALTIDEQIELLEGRGLDIPDTDRTARHLSNISYYRMSAYMVPFRKPNPDGSLSNEEVNIAQSKRLYYTLCIILYLLQSVNPNHHFREQFRLLLQKYPVVDVRYMGFPENWQEHPLWKI